MKSVLITGARSGIGLGHTRRFAERGAQVFATVRSERDAGELSALADKYDNITVLNYRADDPAGAQNLKRTLQDRPIDLLLANAGAAGGRRQSFGDIDPEGVLALVRTNALAPLELAQALSANVAVSERKIIAFQSSLMGSIGDNGSGGAYAYRISKAAMNMVGRNVANDLRARGVISVLLHPGWVRTRMGGPNGKISVEACVEAQQRLLDGLTLEHSGRFFNYDGRELPW